MDDDRILILAFISYSLGIVSYALSMAETLDRLNIFIIFIAIIVGGLIIFKFPSIIRNMTNLGSDFFIKIKKLRAIKKLFFIIIFTVVVVIILIASSLSKNNIPETQFVKVADSKILTVGEGWEIGNGWKLYLNSIDSRSIPRRAFFTISRNGTIVDDMFLNGNEKYTYNNTL